MLLRILVLTSHLAGTTMFTHLDFGVLGLQLLVAAQHLQLHDARTLDHLLISYKNYNEIVILLY